MLFTTKRLRVLLVGSFVSTLSLAQGPLPPNQAAVRDSKQKVVADTSVVHVADKPVPPGRITIPAGTKVLMELKSPLHTTSATQGSGVYLETLYPVIQSNQIAIPARSQVQGEVVISQRPGHFQRVAEFNFRFTSLIFPNNRVVAIDGALQSIPGSKMNRASGSDGTLRPVDQTEKVIIPAAVGGATGALMGSVHRTGVGTYVGAGLGAGLGLGGTLLRRGDEISLPRGTNIEMLLQSPLILEPEQATFNAQYIPPADPNVEAKDMRADEEQGKRRDAKRFRPRSPLYRPPWVLR